jgi:hypothetical protein
VPFDRRAFLTYSRIAAAGGYAEPVHDIGVTVKASRVEGGKGSPLVASVDVSIVVPRACFKTEDDRQVAHLDVTAFCGDSSENLVGELWQTIDLKLKAETYERALKEGVPYTARVPLKAPARWVKIVVYEPTADIVGTAVSKVK